LEGRIPDELSIEFAKGNLDYFLPIFGNRSGDKISPSGRYAVSRVNPEKIELWEVKSGRFRASLDVAMPSSSWRWYRDYEFVGDDALIYRDGSRLGIWDISENREGTSGLPEGNTDWLGISPDGRYLALKEERDELKILIWDLWAREGVSVLVGLNSEPNSVVFSKDGLLATATGWDKRSLVWEVETGAVIHQLTGHKQGIAAAAFSPDGKTFASSSPGGTVRIWHLTTGREMLSFALEEDLNTWNLTFSNDGEILVLGGIRHAALVRAPSFASINSL
jgi:WD40 repeat protein